MSQEVSVYTLTGALLPNQNFDQYAWEIGSQDYMSVTARPNGTNDAVQVSNVRVKTDANGNGYILFDLANLTADTTDYTLVLTVPSASPGEVKGGGTTGMAKPFTVSVAYNENGKIVAVVATQPTGSQEGPRLSFQDRPDVAVGQFEVPANYADKKMSEILSGLHVDAATGRLTEG
jgi:hypothetical protein